MSSEMKDARWALAREWAEIRGLEYGDFSYRGWQKILDHAQRILDETPGNVSYWAEKFNEGR